MVADLQARPACLPHSWWGGDGQAVGGLVPTLPSLEEQLKAAVSAVMTPAESSRWGKQREADSRQHGVT